MIVTIWEAQPWPPRVPAYYEWELGAAMADLGLRTQFASLREATENSFAGRIVVLRMTSDGESARAHLPAMPSSALAWTHASGPDIAPFGTVDMEAVRSFVRIAPIRLLIDREARLYARALGRVAAHELFHMITRSKEHSERGLMQATLTATELTAEKRPEWLPRNREQAHSAFPQAADGELVAAVSGNRRHE
ncbi:MAG: hypothetical protein U5J83_18165 [Bryobacterales bacterium]|nr:hypothetical protein [Bryobacterales bacterium]